MSFYAVMSRPASPAPGPPTWRLLTFGDVPDLIEAMDNGWSLASTPTDVGGPWIMLRGAPATLIPVRVQLTGYTSRLEVVALCGEGENIVYSIRT